jgi:hypothetical protein
MIAPLIIPLSTELKNVSIFAIFEVSLKKALRGPPE